MKEQYWSMMTNFKYALFYLDQQFQRCVRLNRWINIFLAIASSTAIAGWVIWEQLKPLWAVITGISQVILVINVYLPYQSRIKQTNDLKNKLTPIYDDIESKWFEVDEGKLSDAEINKLHYDMMKKWDKVEGEYFTDDSLYEDKGLLRRAESKKDKYFEIMFGGETV